MALEKTNGVYHLPIQINDGCTHLGVAVNDTVMDGYISISTDNKFKAKNLLKKALKLLEAA